MQRSINITSVGCFLLMLGCWAAGCEGKIADVGSNGMGGAGASESTTTGVGAQASSTEIGAGGWCTAESAPMDNVAIGGNTWHCLWNCAQPNRAIPGMRIRQEAQIQTITSDGERVYWSAIPADAAQSKPNAGIYPPNDEPLLVPNTETINSIAGDLSTESLASYRFSTGTGIPAAAAPVMQIVGDRLYFIDRRDNHIWSCPKLDCRSGTPAGDNGSVTSFVIDSSGLYWIGDGVYRCDPSACPQTTTRFKMLAPDLATAPFSAGKNLLGDASFLYLVDNRRIVRIPKDDSTGFTVLAMDELGVVSLTLHDNVLYWLSADAPGALRKLALNDPASAVVSLAADIGAGKPCDIDTPDYAWPLQSIAVDGSDVFFALPAIECATGLLYRCKTSGCAGNAQVLAADPLLQAPIAVDAGHVYFTVGAVPPSTYMLRPGSCYGFDNGVADALHYLVR